MHRKTLFGTVAALALIGGSAMAQDAERVEMPNDGRLTVEMDDAGQPMMDDAGNPVVLNADGTPASADDYRIDDAGEIILLVQADEADAEVSTDAEADTEAQTVVEGQATAGSGEFVVEQGEPTVDVTVPDPQVTVNQAQPEVTVEQPTPEITVQVAPPTVNVEQQQPVITVEQQQPVVTVRIPEPIVTIRMPEPEVQVSQDQPQVQVETPEPIVRYIRPEPQIQVEQAEAQVNVTQTEPQVQVNRTQQADVRIEQAEADVQIEETGEAEVTVTESGEPQVQVEQAEAAEVQVEQGDAQVDVQREGEADAGALVAADGEATATREIDPAAAAELETQGYIVTADTQESEDQRTQRMTAYEPYADMTSTDLIGMNVLAADGEDVGEVDNLANMGDRLMAVVGVGGFLGLGETNVAVPLERFQMSGDDLVIEGLNSDQIQNLQDYDEASGEYLPTDGRIGDYYQ